MLDNCRTKGQAGVFHCVLKQVWTISEAFLHICSGVPLTIGTLLVHSLHILQRKSLTATLIRSVPTTILLVVCFYSPPAFDHRYLFSKTEVHSALSLRHSRHGILSQIRYLDFPNPLPRIRPEQCALIRDQNACLPAN